MDYTSLLRQAHIAKLKQKYLDIMEQARKEKEEKEKQYFADAQSAYIEKEKQKDEKPQQLRAAGISGGANEEEIRDVDFDYEKTIESLKRKRKEHIDEYLNIIERQTRLMENEINEYNARIALEDSAAAEKAAASAAKTSTGTRSKTTNDDETVSSEGSSAGSGRVYVGESFRKRV